MLVEIPHSLGELITPVNFENDDDLNITPNIIRFIFLIKHKIDNLSCLIYVYVNGTSEIYFIDPSNSASIEKNVCKNSNNLYDISKPWGTSDVIRIYSEFEFNLTGPFNKINTLVFNQGLDINDCNIFICTFTKKNLVTKNRNNWLFNDIQSTVVGKFVPFNDEQFSGNWRRFTKEEYIQFYGDYQVFKGVKPTYTNDIETTTEDPRYSFIKNLKNNTPQFMSPKSSNSIIESQRIKNKALQNTVVYDREKIDKNRKALVTLHLIFKKLKSKNIHMLILTQMLPTPKYSVGSIIYHFNYQYSYVIKDIYMYLDLNYGWNIKYLCADLSDVKNPDLENIKLRFLKQRDLTIPTLLNSSEKFDEIPFRKVNYELQNNLFDHDTSLWEYNNKTIKCRKHHFKCRWKCSVYNCNNKVNYNGIKCKYHSGEGAKWKMRCHHKKCNGPDEIKLEQFSKMCPVVKITKMGTDLVTYYNVKKIIDSSILNKNFTVTEHRNIDMNINSKTDNTAFFWSYTRKFT